MAPRFFFSSSLFFLTALMGCASKPPAPPWITGPTRAVDNGYIVYIGKGEDVTLEKATFKAEAVALGDLANECSFIPKGARIEDRYEQVTDKLHTVYAKVGIQFEECESAKKTIDPDAVKSAANVAMTEELKRYQDLYYTNETPQPQVAAGPSGGVTVAQNYWARPASTWTSTDYFIVRQQVVYWKQAAILQPGAYAPGTPAAVQYANNVQPTTSRLRNYEATNPQVRATAAGWSGVQASPGFHAPAGFSHAGAARMMSAPRGSQPRGSGGGNRYRRRRRGRRWHASLRRRQNVD